MISNFEDPPFAPDPACPSCGVPWTMHDGAIFICAKLQAQMDLFKTLAEQHLQLIDDFKAYKEKYPQSPNPPNPHIFPLQDAAENEL